MTTPPPAVNFTTGEFSGYVQDLGNGSLQLMLRQATNFVSVDVTPVAATDLAEGVKGLTVNSGHLGPA